MQKTRRLQKWMSLGMLIMMLLSYLQPVAAQQSLNTSPSESSTEQPSETKTPSLEESTSASTTLTPVACQIIDEQTAYLPLLLRPNNVTTPTNQAPRGQSCRAEVAAGSTAAINLAELVSDSEQGQLTASIEQTPEHGTAVIDHLVLIYTATNTLNVTDVIRYVVTDPQQANGHGRIEIVISEHGQNNVPVASDTVVTVKMTETVTLDLSTLAFDQDNDPLTYTLTSAPVTGTTTLEGTTIWYTPTTALTTNQYLEYSIEDGRGGSDTGTVTFSPQSTRLHFMPGSVLMAGTGETQAISVTAYDPLGNQVDASSLDLEWVTTQPLSVSIAPGTDGTTAQITATTELGSIPIIVRSRTLDYVEPGLFMLSVAEIKPGVQLLSDAELVFPQANPIPNRDTAFPTDGQGNTVIGPWTAEEVFNVFQVQELPPNNGNEALPIFSYPVILRGEAPAVGQLLVAGESAPVMGEVVEIIEEREGFALVKVTIKSFNDLFHQIAVDFNSDALIDSGLMRSEQFIFQESKNLEDKLSGQRRPDALNGILENCETSVGASAFEIKALSPAITVRPGVTGNLLTRERSDGVSYTSHFLVQFGMLFSVEAGVAIKMMPSIGLEVSCDLAPTFRAFLPDIGVLALINLLIGPNANTTPKAEFGVKAQGGFTIEYAYTGKLGFDFALGYEYKDPDGFNGIGEWIKRFDPIASLEPTVNHFEPSEFLEQLKVEISVQLVAAANASFIFGGRLIDWALKIPGLSSRASELRAKLEAELLSFKLGPQLKVEWGSSGLVRLEKGNFKSGMPLNLIAGAELNLSSMFKLGEQLKLGFKWVDLKLFEATVPLASYYAALTPGTANVSYTGKLKVDVPVTFEVTPQKGLPGDPMIRGEVYYGNRKLTDLQLDGTNKLKGMFVLDQEFCNAVEATPTGKGKLDVLAYNWLPNNISGWPTSLSKEAANYVGEIELGCRDFSLTIATNPALPTLKSEILTPCRDDVRLDPEPLKIPYNIVANDDWKNLTKLQLNVERVGGGQMIVSRQAGDGTTKQQELKLEGEMLFPQAADESEQVYTFTAIASAPDGSTTPRERKEVASIRIKWQDCTDTQITLGATTSVKNTADGYAIACLNKQQDLVQINVNVQAVNSDGVNAIHLNATYNGQTKQHVVEGSNTSSLATNYNFSVSLRDNPDLTRPLEVKITALVRIPIPSGGEEIAKKEQIIKIWWVLCEEVKKYDNRTTFGTCWINQEERVRTDQVYKNLALEEVRREEGTWSAWYIKTKTPFGTCGRPIRRGGGDPHLQTADGFQYDSFALGEFIYLRPRGDETGFTIQARQERVNTVGNFMLFPWTSWITALAIEADGTVFEFHPQADSSGAQQVLINGTEQTLEQGLHSFGEVDLKIMPDRTELVYGDNSITIQTVLGGFLDFMFDVPRDGTHEGMLGTPDGDIGNDFTYPDGTTAIDEFAMADAWRIHATEESLFTYTEGAGPHTYNEAQIGQGPSLQELAPFITDAEILLQLVCDTENLDQIAVRNTAIELLTGRDPAELLSTGLCWYVVAGQVTNSLVAGVPVPGAKVTVTAPNIAPCITFTDRRGNYQCALPSMGQAPTVTVSVSERGTGSTTTQFEGLPEMGGSLKQAGIDLQVAPTTVQINGLVQDAGTQALVNTEVRVTGPQQTGFDSTYARAGGDGRFTAYLMLDDGTTEGNARYDLRYSPNWSNDPKALGYTQSISQSLPSLTANEITTISPTLQLDGGIVRFRGRATYANDPTVGVFGAPVSIKPTMLIEGWNGCEILTGAEGFYECEVYIRQNTTFAVVVQVGDAFSSEPITVDLTQSGISSIIDIVQNINLELGVLQINGTVKDSLGNLLPGAEITVSSNATVPSIQTITADGSGAYTITTGFAADQTEAPLSLQTKFSKASGSTALTLSELQANSVNTRTIDLLADGVELAFSGTVINTFAPAVPLQGSIIISRGNELLCEEDLDNGTYACAIELDQASTAESQIQYSIVGTWGEIQAQTVLVGTPPTGMSRLLTRSFTVQPTTLKLDGRITTGGSIPLAGANVRVEAGDVYVDTKTDTAGNYQLIMVLPPNIDQTTLQYRVLYRQTVLNNIASVALVPQQLNTHTEHINYTINQATFKGNITTNYGAALAGTRIEINAPEWEAPCITMSGTDGTFQCITLLNTTNPITVTWTASGFWGSQTFTSTIDPSTGVLQYTRNFRVAPTTLRLHGRVTTPHATPVSGASVTVRGATIEQIASTKTNSDGSYELLALIDAGTTPLTTNFSLHVGFGQATINRSFQASFTPGQITTAQQDVVLNGAALRFEGSLYNILTNTPLRDSRVYIDAVNRGRLCSVETLSVLQNGTYLCETLLLDPEPLELIYTVRGPWGSDVFTESLDTTPAIGQVKTISKRLDVRATSVELRGTITTPEGQALSGVVVAITAPSLTQAVYAKTDTNGKYQIFGTIRSGTVSDTLSYRVELGDQRIEQQVIIGPTAGQLLPVETNFTLNGIQQLVLEGHVHNGTYAPATMNGSLTIFDANLQQEICQTSLSNGSYNCAITNNIEGDRLLSYRLTGTWGSLIASAELVQAGIITYTRDFTATPALMIISGTLQTADNILVDDAKVNIKSYDVIPGTLTNSTVPVKQGTFSTTMFLAPGVTTGQVLYSADVKGNMATAVSTFNVPTNQKLITVEQALVIEQRTIELAGSVVNTYNQNLAPESTLLITSAELGPICAVTIRQLYQCKIQTTHEGPLSFTYALSGGWGSTTVQRIVDVVPPPGETSKVVVNLPITPTMLQITGRVQNTIGEPIIGARVSIDAPFIATQRYETHEGAYTLTLVLNQDTVTETAVVQASWVGNNQTRPITIDVLPGQPNTMQLAPWVFDTTQARSINVYVTLQNQLVPNEPAAQPRGDIIVRDINGIPWCQRHATELLCTIKVYDARPLELIVESSGEWGTIQRHMVINDIPEAGATNNIDVLIPVKVTTLLVTGNIQRPDGSAVAGANINLSFGNSTKLSTAQIKAGTDGRYQAYMLVPPGLTGGDLNVYIASDGISQHYAVNGISITSGQLNQRSDTWIFDLRRIRFRGTLTNELVPGMAVPGRLTITSADFNSAWYCEAIVRTQTGAYECDAIISSDQPFEVNYRFRGDWGTLDIPATISDIPSIGGTVIFERNVLARPTTLIFKGHVEDSAGKPLANTRVVIEDPTEGSSVLEPQRLTIQTDKNGVYTATALLDRDLTQLRTRYAFTYSGISKQATTTFTGINQQQLNTLEYNIELDARALVLTGEVNHRDIPELPVGAKLIIRGSNQEILCETFTSTNGTYQCAVAGVPTDPFSATYTLSGDWGSNVFQVAIPFGSVGSSTTVTYNPLVTPLALRLHGTVRDGSTPIAGVELAVVGGFVSIQSPPARTTTNAQGEYELLVILKEGLSTGVLNYRLTLGQTFGTVAVPYAITSGVVLDVSKDIQFTTRELAFGGNVYAAEAMNLGLAARVQISSPLLGELCSINTGTNAAYTCEVQVINQESLTLHYIVFGNWGRTEFDVRVPTGTAGTTTTVTQNIAAPVTVLHVEGTVTDEQEQPLTGAHVRVLGDSLVTASEATTSPTGTYSLDIALQAGRELPAVRFEVTYNNRTIQSERVYEVVPRTRTNVTADLSFAVRDFLFTGKVQNSVYPTMTTWSQEVVIDSPQLGRLCRATTTSDGSYSCLAQLNVSTPFSTVHTLAADWGSQILTNSVTTLPALGGQQTITQTITYTPAMIVATGTVQTPNGVPLSGITVAISSTQLSALNNVLATTSVSGSYTLPLMLKASPVPGSLRYTISTSGLSINEDVVFTPVAGQLVTVTHPITVSQRTIFFRGYVRNQHVVDMDIAPESVTVLLPSTQQTCTAHPNTASETSFYTCSIIVTSTEELQVEYALDADWGTAAFTGTVPAGDYGSLTFADRNLFVAPTTLFLTGIASSSNGEPLSNTEVEVRSTAFSQGNLDYKDTTGTDGIYGIFVVLREGVTAESVSYIVKRNNLIANHSGSFTAEINELTTVEKRLEMNERVVGFRGRILNTLANNAAVGAYSVSVDSPQIGHICTWYPTLTLFGSNYRCSETVAELGAFDVNYTIISDWGTVVLTGTVPSDSGGQETWSITDLVVAPTTIRVSGFVADPDNIRLPNTKVEFVGGIVALSNVVSSTTTNAEGAFTLDLVLTNEGEGSGPISYTLQRNNAVVTGSELINVPVGQRTPVDLALDFDARSVTFNGNVLHADLPWMNVPANHIRVSVGSNELCQWNRKQPTDTFYTCTGQLTTTQALSATYYVEGVWGSQVLTTTIPAATYGTNTPLRNDLLVSPTTVRLYGNVTTSSGTALNGATVIAQGPGLVAPGSKSTQSGAYELFVLLKDGVTTTPITLTATYQSASMQQVRSVTAQPRQVNSVNVNWTFIARRVTFEGNIVSAFDPTVALGMRSLKVEDTQGTLVCESVVRSWESPRSYHSCSANVFTTDAFSVTYTIKTDDLLPQVITGTVQAGAAGSTINVPVVLRSTATLVQFIGVVSNAEANTPLQAAQIYLDSSWFSEASSVFDGASDAQGRYTVTVALQENVLHPDIEYQMQYGSIGEYVETSVEVTQHALTTVSRNFTVAEREYYFSGYIYHVGIPDTRVDATAVEVRDAQRGTLCTSTSSSGSEWYGCTINLTGTAPLSITYVITGLWGTETIVGSVVTPTVAVGQRQNIVFDPYVSPTTLKLTGVVRRPDATPVSGATVRVRSSALMYTDSWDIPYVSTNSSGVYTLYVLLKPEALSGTLEYEISYASSVLKESRPFTATKSQIMAFNEEWTYNARRLYMYGSFTNGWITNTIAYANQVVITDPVYGELCRWTSSGIDSGYYCYADVRTANPLTPVFTITGPWGSDVFTATTPITPPSIGVQTNVQTNLIVRPTMLRVTGTVSDPEGMPIGSARVLVTVPGSTGYNQSYLETTSSATGAYTLDLTLKPSNLAGILNMSASYGEASRTLTSTYAVSATTFTSITVPVTLDQRRIIINGTVAHASFPEMTIPVNQVHGQASNGRACSGSRYYASETFTCSFVVTNTTSFSTSLVITGSWGTAVLPPVTIDQIPAVGQSGSVNYHAVISPTTLLLSGTVRLPDTSGAANARVEVRSTAFAGSTLGSGGEDGSSSGIEVYAYTDVTGRYTLPVLLRSEVTTGTLIYQTYVGNAYGPQETVLFADALPNTTTTFTHDINFNSRVVYLSGTLINTLAPEMDNVHSEAITITDSLGKVLCIEGWTGYNCSVSLAPQATQLTIIAEGVWGVNSWTLDVPAGEVGSYSYIEYDLPVTATTLLINANLINHEQQPIRWADVSVEAPWTNVVLNENSDGNGNTSLYVLIPDDATTGSLTVTFTNDNYIWKTHLLTYTVVPNTLNTMDVQLVHDIRLAVIRGNIRNSRTQEYLASQEVLVEVLGTDMQCLKQAPPEGSIDNYYCAFELTSTAAFPVRVTVRGDWGTEVQTYTLQSSALGTRVQLDQDLQLTPANMLELSGTLRDAANVPIGSAYLWISSPALAQSSRSHVQTHADGTFTQLLTLKADVDSGEISYGVYHNDASYTLTQIFTAVTPPLSQAIHELQLP